MLKNIKINNLRSLVDTGEVPLKPVTVLVGKNSSGKSTFARVFPLLRQSIEELTIGPILWYGRYVDFGDFNNAISRNATEGEISFGFCVEIGAREFVENSLGRRRYALSVARALSIENRTTEVKINISLSFAETTYTSKVEIYLYGVRCIIQLNKDEVLKIQINDNVVWEKSEDIRCQFSQMMGLLPDLGFVKRSRVLNDDSASSVTVWDPHDSLGAILYKRIKNFVHGNVKDDKIRAIQSRLAIYSPDDMVSIIKTVPNAPVSWRDHVRKIDTSSWSFDYLYEAIFAANLEVILFTLNRKLGFLFRNIRYIEPLRATAQRYYRGQELAVNEIDSKGANVAFYLDSLSPRRKKSFDEWMVKHFGASIIAEKDGGHIALKMRDEITGCDTNLADIGFGFSQLLPIAVQLWMAINREDNVFARVNKIRSPITIVIEQPELHLHPEYQARIADVIASVLSASREEKLPVQVILETHSSSMINRFGQLVSEGRISREDLAILLFDNDSNGMTTISKSAYDEDGVLMDWPYGFFDGDLT